ncbi:iron uptake transporter deferrochelatase/peroxidase subunit [Tabrizicola sp. J26]|uniref:iron uptake transporter deferrochelatase/peroxidase subunit n=1 Tax=Alitabrizicola rongguiensis TaxID=2909234 RepID=UPI001F1AB529|nr:iron uptake transporter deferrochelatase/peroxidase subunit [Tabrizicola rongguiensis]MCF1708277.1 iron uptake transporter deferrochelatase/peroxidase subunit [Tabrizicola rongguiensis]
MTNDHLRTSRRGLFLGAAALATAPRLVFASTEAETRHAADAPIEDAARLSDRIQPYGPHQAGITTPRPANGMIASFHVLADNPADLERLFRRLTDRIIVLTKGGPVPELDPKLPPSDSGILGPVLTPDALTVTVGLGASLFEDRPWLQPAKPRALVRMAQFRNDALIADLCHGDLVIQLCANTQDTVIHALRDIVKSIPDQLVLKWAQAGNVPVISPPPGAPPESARNLLGFRDGSANPDSADASLMDTVVWVGPANDEPDWATGGSYMAVRIIRNNVERWDRTPLLEQERIFGRTKITGAPLDHPHGTEAMAPDFAADPHGKVTPLDSHIRMANPRTPASKANLILRRPFNYVNGVLKNGQLDQGLLFICWQADIEKGFITVQRRLDGEPLEEYIKPVGGGYFFALPGFAEGGDDFLGRTLIAALSPTSQDSSQSGLSTSQAQN